MAWLSFRVSSLKIALRLGHVTECIVCSQDWWWNSGLMLSDQITLMLAGMTGIYAKTWTFSSKDVRCRFLACQYADSILRTQLVVVIGLIKPLKLFWLVLECTHPTIYIRVGFHQIRGISTNEGRHSMPLGPWIWYQKLSTWVRELSPQRGQ